MVEESNRNVFLIQIDAPSFAEFKISETVKFRSSGYRESTVIIIITILFNVNNMYIADIE